MNTNISYKETPTKKELYDFERLENKLKDSGHIKSSEDIIENILEDLKAYKKDKPQNDDLTIVSVHVLQ